MVAQGTLSHTAVEMAVGGRSEPVGSTRSVSPWPSAAPHAPWVGDLRPEVASALALPPFEEVASSARAVYDIAVVGVGIAGLRAAFAAAEAGARVIALDAAPVIGWGATGRNAGILSAGVNMALESLPDDSPFRAMWPATTRELLGVVAAARQPGALVEASLTGALSLAESEAAARRLRREARARRALGLRAEMWTPAQVAEHTKGRLRTDTVVEALWLPDEGRVQPLTLLAQVAHEARAAGVTLAGAAPVEAWEAERARTGAASRWRIRLAGGRTLQARGLIVATGPVERPTARIYALAADIALPETFPLFWDAAPYTYCDYRPDATRIITSGGRYGRAGGSRNAASYYQRLARRLGYWLPELANAVPSHAWAVDLDVSADLTPQARDLGAPAPGVAIEGLGALGVLPGSVLGRQAGAALAETLAR